ncbi:MAG: TRAP transporter large permease subunit [Deltaproteobacteria bacterium]|nr:TRAP transporter large permease subunit [Deltaproteobacteria bacterium]
MEWWIQLVAILGSLILLMISGLPVAFCFMLVNFLWAFFLWGGFSGLEQLIISMFGSVSTFTLLPVPLFILMGEVMFLSKVGPKMLAVLEKWMGRLPGRLSLLAVSGGVLFSTLTGTSLASVAMLGSVLVPEMEQKGYKKPMSLGPILGSGGLAMMIPPSALAILFGSIGEVSIGGILMAIIIPGLLMATLYALYIIIRCFLQPSLAPAYDTPSISLREKITDSLRYLLPVGGIIFLVVGVIFLGIATPTEAAATGAIGTFILAAFFKRFNPELVKKSAFNTVGITVMMFMIITGARAFTQILAFTGATKGLIDFALGLPLSPILILIATQFVVFFLGMFMSPLPIMMITLPIFMPVVEALGYHSLWYGVIYLINIEMASTSPPFGMSLFVMKGVAPEGTTMGEIYRAALPFLYCDVIAMALVLILPPLALWLPGLAG